MAPDFFVTGSAGALEVFEGSLDANGLNEKMLLTLEGTSIFRTKRDPHSLRVQFTPPQQHEMLVRQFDDNIKFTEKLLELPFQNIIPFVD